MSDVKTPPGRREDIEANPDDPIARLLRLAGPRPAAPDAAAARVRSAVHAHWRETVRIRRRRGISRIAAPLAVAAALTLTLGIALRLRAPIAPPDAMVATVVRSEGRVLPLDARAPRGEAEIATGTAIRAGAGLRTGPHARAALRLSAGASVRLDTGTRLRLIAPAVLELLEGAVYVDSGARPSGSPSIEIRAALGRVRDVGTLFEVRLAGGEMRLSVREGSAALARDERLHTAAAGTRLRVDARGAVTSDAIPLQGPEWDWTLAVAPPFDLEGRTLRDYLDWLARETGWRVRYADASISAGAPTITLHGSISGLRPDETPGVVLPTCGLLHRLEGGTLLVERRAGAGGP